MMNKYEVVKYGDKYTIAVYDDGYKAYILNDEIYGFYTWDTKAEAQKACNLYNNYDGEPFLYQHQPIFDDELGDYSLELVEIYEAFNMIKPSKDKKRIYNIDLFNLILAGTGNYVSDGTYKSLSYENEEEALAEFEMRKNELAKDYAIIKTKLEQTGNLPQHTEGVTYSAWEWSEADGDYTNELVQESYTYDVWGREV